MQKLTMVVQKSPRRQRVKVSATLRADLFEWLSQRSGEGMDFASLSHALDRAILALQAQRK